MRQKILISIVGPTAVGKSSLSIQLAKYFGSEILSSDSRQCYKELNIGTATPSTQELQKVTHHFVNDRSIKNPITAGEFEETGLGYLKSMFTKGEIQFMVGGSGLFVDAVCRGFDVLPPADNEVRSSLEAEFELNGLKNLVLELESKDPEMHKLVDLFNPRRIIRALEVIRITGKPFSSLLGKTLERRPFQVIKVGLNTSRDILYERINERVNTMLDAGLLDEVESLLEFKDLKPLRTVGYQEFFPFFEGSQSLEQSIELIKRNSRRYSKRQMTWFNRDTEIKWFSPEDKDIRTFIEKSIDELD